MERYELGQAKLIRKPPDYFTFHWDGAVHEWGCGFTSGEKLSTSSVLDSILMLKNYDYQLFPALAKFKMDGDWIIDTRAEMPVRLAALCDIIKSAGGPAASFTRKELPRTVVVASALQTAAGRLIFAELKNGAAQASASREPV